MRPRRLKLSIHVDNGWSGFVLSFRHSVILSFSNLSNENFSSLFSQELWGIQDWNLEHMWTVGRCIVYTEIWLLLLIYPFISSFFFLSNIQTLKVFVTLFSGTVRPRKLKLGTHVDSGQMYGVYRNRAAAAYLSHYFFIFLSLQFSNIKIFHHTFLRNCEALKVETCIVYTGIRLLLLIHSFISSFFLSLNFQNGAIKNFVILFWTLRPRRLKLATHVHSGQMCHVYRNQAAAAYPLLYFFIFLSL